MPQRPLRTVRVVASLLLLLATSGPVSAEWRRIDSPNFVVVGDVGGNELRDIARRFESFREVLARVLTEKFIATAVPTVVVVFPSDRAFTPFKPRFNGKPVELTGLFLPRRDINYIALVRDWDENAIRVVFHEYAHLITSNVTGTIPVWLNEGLAEFYSTFELVGDREALIGRPVPGHLARLNERSLLSLDELLNVKHDSPLYNEGDRRSVFYAQSWALTHMLLVAQPSRRDKLGAYVASLETGTPPVEAWQRAFGSDRIDRELQRYIGRSVFSAFRFRFNEKTTSFDGTAVPVAAADAQAFLAHFLAEQQRYDEAVELLDRQAPAAGAWPAVVRAWIAASRSNDASAEKALLGLPAEADWLTAYFAGVTLADLVAGRREAAPGPAQTARAFLDAAQKTRGEIPHAMARTVAMELRGTGAPPPEALKVIERARTLAPAREEYAFLHAQVLAEMDSYAAAAGVLRSLAANTSQPEVRESAARILRQIEEMQKWKAARAAAGRASLAPSAGERPRDDGAAPGPGVRKFVPSFRPVADGEERIEGVLERIDCAAKSAAFVIKSGQATARLTAPGLDQVEFITYRDDLTGSVGCGVLKEPLPVYVTLAVSADRKTSRVVAVEFLPKPR